MDNATVKKIDKKTECESIIDIIDRSLKDITKDFLRIGWSLWYVKEYEIFSVNGYRNIYEFAKGEFGFSKTSTKNFINICLCYSKLNNGQPTFTLADEYKFYNKSQLAEMLSLSEKERKQISPDMIVDDIKKFKKVRSGQISDHVESEKIEFKGINKVESTVSAPEDASNAPIKSGDNEDLKFAFEQSQQPVIENYIDFKDIFGFTKDALVQMPAFKFEKTIRLVKDAADYTLAFPKILEYLKPGYAIRICLYKEVGQDGEE